VRYFTVESAASRLRYCVAVVLCAVAVDIISDVVFVVPATSIDCVGVAVFTPSLEFTASQNRFALLVNVLDDAPTVPDQ
jgi:hypothetical protein